MEFNEPEQSVHFEDIYESEQDVHFANPLSIYRWVCYTSDEQPLALQGNVLIGINSLLIQKPMGLESPLLFKKCIEGSKKFRATLVADWGPVKINMKFENAYVSAATLEGQALISRYGKETIRINFEKIYLLVQTTEDKRNYKEPGDPLALFQEYADLRDEEEERELREQVLGNFRES